jgi:predicted dehydrogenase
MQSFPKRLDPVNIRMKELLDENAVGRVGIVRVRHGHGFGLSGGLEGRWFVKPEFAGRGAFLDEGAHGADLLRWLLGEPAEVTARIGRLITDFDVDDNGTAIYAFDSGVVAELTSSWTWQAATNCVEIFGDGGTIIAQGTDNASKDMTGDDCLRIYRAASAERKWETIDVACAFKSDNFQGGVMQAFVRCVADGEAPPATAEDGREALRMILAAYESSDRGRSVTIR